MGKFGLSPLKVWVMMEVNFQHLNEKNGINIKGANDPDVYASE